MINREYAQFNITNNTFELNRSICNYQIDYRYNDSRLRDEYM